jgi:hypothetical protein
VVEGGLHIAAAAVADGVVASIEGPSRLGEAVDASRNVLLEVFDAAAEPGVQTGGAAGRAVAVGGGELEAVGTQRAPVGIGPAAAGTAPATVAAAGTGEVAGAGAGAGAGAAGAEVVAVAGVEVAGLKSMAGPSEWGRPGPAVESDTDKGWGFPLGNSAFHFAGPSSGSPTPRDSAPDGKPR